MICVSLGELDFEQCLAALQGLELAEIRLDRMNLSTRQIEEIFSLPKRLIAAFRPGSESVEERKTAMLAAISAGAGWVDIGLEAADDYKKEIIQAARSRDCRVIVSFHDFEATPPAHELEDRIEECFDAGADIAKLACLVRSAAECARIISLYESFVHRKGRLIALGMGEKGRLTRVAAPLLGAPFTFAALSAGKETAPGQMDIEQMNKVLAILKPHVT